VPYYRESALRTNSKSDHLKSVIIALETCGFFVLMTEKKITGKVFKRTGTFERVDQGDRRVDLAFASDKPIGHEFGALVLSMDEAAVRLDRLRAGAPLLVNHDTDDQVGVIEDVRLGTDGVARATVRFSKSARGEEIYQDVVDGIRQSVSVGFVVHQIEEMKTAEGERYYRATEWEPLEVSIVSVPADYSVGVGRSMDIDEEKQMNKEDKTLEEVKELLASVKEMLSDDTKGEDYKEVGTEEEMTGEDETKEIAPEEEGEITTEEEEDMENKNNQTASRAAEMVELGQVFGEVELARDLALQGKGVEDLKSAIAEKRAASTAKVQNVAPAVEAVRQNGIGPAHTPAFNGRLKAFKSERAAYNSGKFLQAVLGKDEAAMRYCKEQGLIRAHSGEVNSTGGALVPTEFENAIIDLRVEYGVFRANANVVPMSSDVKIRPRRNSGLTAYFVGSGDAITESEKTWDNVSLVAKKVGVLAKYESELNEDAIISIADDLVNEIAYAFAQKEDECGFNGDGTSTFGGIVGVREKLKGLSGTIANIAGLQVASGNAYSEILLADLQGLIGRLPQFARRAGGNKFYCSQQFYATVLTKLAQAVGGVTYSEISGALQPTFFGVPVEITEVMPSVAADSQVCLLYGNLAMAAMMGDRRGVEISMSDSHSTDFASDVMAVRGTQRFDINVHDVGNASGTASERLGGPIVGLITAAA
jgi:HK97 family phage major capsid protein/HK97 family phage prohead protease